MIGLAIDPETNDVFLRSDGSLAIVRDAEAVGQHARQRLLTYEGEWFIDNTAGVTWLRDVLGQAFDPALAEALVKAELLGTYGVTAISSAFSVSFDSHTRGLRIREISVTTIYDDAEVFL